MRNPLLIAPTWLRRWLLPAVALVLSGVSGGWLFSVWPLVAAVPATFAVGFSLGWLARELDKMGERWARRRQP